MNRNKTNGTTGAAATVRQQSNRSSSSSITQGGGKQPAKATESTIANNNVVTEVNQNVSPPTRNEGQKPTSGKGKGSSVTQKKGSVPSDKSNEGANPGNANDSPSPTTQDKKPSPENSTNKGDQNNKNGQEQQQKQSTQKSITFSDPPARTQSSSSTSTKSTNGTTSLKPKGVLVNSNSSNSENKSQESKGNNNNNNNKTSAVPSVVQLKQTTKTFPMPVSQQRYPGIVSRSMVSLERSRNFRAFIEKAMNEHKIYTCCGVYPAIRNALKKRGWVEKPGPLAYSRSANATLSQTKAPDDESDVAWMQRILKEYPADFTWVIRRDNIDWKTISLGGKEQLINRFPKAWFTTKVGLAAILQNMHWFSETGVADTFFPRCYRLCLEEERQAFQDDFRLTACMGYLKYFVDTYETKGHTALADIHSKITPLSVDFAARQLGNYIRMRKHEDIDWLLPPNFMTQHWDAFIHQYYAVVNERKRLRFDSPEAVQVKYETAKKMLSKISQYWPQINLDGVYNMWICKPGARSRGKGIVIMNNLEKIMDLLSQSNFREANWVVQKYIEKPMLIYKTKFDIRQWFLVTDWTPLTLWFYKESYVRFCTKPFVLEDFHESIHLCNNAIQCRYTNSEQRDSNLPDENMWSSDTFQAYLKTIGKLDAWPMIYSGMKQAIVGVLLSSQETIESRKGCFELYGADFMLTDDFRPWLIEINSCPCMAASTSVTARMCAQCLEDTIKVVVDRRSNRNAETGNFEMIYRQNAATVQIQQFSGHDLTIVGKKVSKDIDWPMTISKSVTTTVKAKKDSQAALAKSKSENSNANNNSSGKQTLTELLQKLRVRNQEMFQGALATQKAKIDSIFEATTSVNSPTAPKGNKGEERVGGATLIEKMRALKSPLDTPTAKRTTSAKSSDKTGKSEKSQKSIDTPTESNPGKGEDPSRISPKFTDADSIAYLMRNSQNSSGLISDILKDAKESKETAQEMIVRTKKLEASKKLLADEDAAQPVPKTLAEVKAMVDSINIGKTPRERQQSDSSESDRHGKTSSSSITTHMTYLSAILSQSSSGNNGESESNSENKEIITPPKIESPNAFSDSEQETPAIFDDSSAKLSGEYGPSPDVDSASVHSKDSIVQSKSESTINLEKKSDSAKEPNKSSLLEEGNLCSSSIRRTKSLSFDAGKPTRSWMSETEYDLSALENKVAEKDLEQTSATSPVQDKKEVVQRQQKTIIQQASGDESDANVKMYRSILLTSSSSSTSSFSDSDNDFNSNTSLLDSHFIPILSNSNSIVQDTEAPTEDSSQSKSKSAPSTASSVAKPKPTRLYQRRGTISSSRRQCPRRHPCYRVILEPPNHQQHRFILNNRRKSGPTLPLKTVNLLLPSDYL